MIDVSRIGEFVVGKRKMVPVGDFEIGAGLSGGDRLKRDLDLSFVPRGKVEVIVQRKDHQTYHQVVLSSLKP